MKRNFIKEMNLKRGDEVYYASRGKEPWQSIDGIYTCNGTSRDDFLKSFTVF